MTMMEKLTEIQRIEQRNRERVKAERVMNKLRPMRWRSDSAYVCCFYSEAEAFACWRNYGHGITEWPAKFFPFYQEKNAFFLQDDYGDK